jgi:hypothetical protein
MHRGGGWKCDAFGQARKQDTWPNMDLYRAMGRQIKESHKPLVEVPPSMVVLREVREDEGGGSVSDDSASLPLWDVIMVHSCS